MREILALQSSKASNRVVTCRLACLMALILKRDVSGKKLCTGTRVLEEKVDIGLTTKGKICMGRGTVLEYILEVSVFGTKEETKASRPTSKEVNERKCALSGECFGHRAECEPDWYVSNGPRRVSQSSWSERQFPYPTLSTSLSIMSSHSSAERSRHGFKCIRVFRCQIASKLPPYVRPQLS